MYDEKSSQINNIASILPFPGTTITTRQSEIANTSPCHIPVLGNVPPIFVVTSFLCSLEFLYF